MGTECKEHGDYLPCLDTAEDLQVIDKSFSDRIACLFATLKTIEDRINNDDPPGKFKLTIQPPTRTVDYCNAGDMYAGDSSTLDREPS
jgi:hypothetical protein